MTFNFILAHPYTLQSGYKGIKINDISSAKIHYENMPMKYTEIFKVVKK